MARNRRIAGLLGRALTAAALVVAVPLLGGGSPSPVAANTSAGPQPGPVNAANTYLWGNAAESWDWEEGESTDPWQIYSDGTGRASIFVAMLALDSGDTNWDNSGTVKATLGNAGHTYGRWEARVRGPIWPTGHSSYTMSFGLVPARDRDRKCGAPSVNLGTWTGYQSATTIGVTRGGTSWQATRQLSHTRDNWHTLAVEITPTRISWFLDAKVTATLRTRAAVPGVPLVPQLAMQAPSGAEMNHTRLTADWVRYYSLARPDARSVDAQAPKQSKAPAC
jgi:hypothetical protein